jgi:hypothetical protein
MGSVTSVLIGTTTPLFSFNIFFSGIIQSDTKTRRDEKEAKDSTTCARLWPAH